LTYGGYTTEIWGEGRAMGCLWRGYLLDAGFTADILGCNATDYRGRAFYASYNGGNVANWRETSRTHVNLRRYPAYVWYGPGTYSTDNVRSYAGGNILIGGGKWSQTTIRMDLYGPLFTCPQVWTTYSGGQKTMEPSHRSNLSVTGLSATQWPVAANVGFSDGSVRFFEAPYTGATYYYDPTK
jgi:hypothetical protein